MGDMSGDEIPEGMEGVLEEMLGALMSKELLYEPLKELSSQVSLTSQYSKHWSNTLALVVPNVPIYPPRHPAFGQNTLRSTAADCYSNYSNI